MNKKPFIVLVATMFISMLAMGIVSPFLPIYAEELGASNLEIGLVQAAFSIAGLGTLVFVGRWSDRLGRKPFLLVGLGVLTLSSVGLMYADSPLLLIIMRFVQGLGASAHLPIAQAYLGDITPKGGEGKWMGYFNAVLFAGVGAGPLLGGLISDTYSIVTTFLFMAILDFAGLIATMIFLKEMPRKVAAEEHSSILAPLKSRVMRGVLVQRMTNGIGTSTLMTFIPVFANNLGITTGLIGILIAMRTPVSLLQTYSGNLADKWNRRWMVIQGILFTMVAMALVPITGGFWPLLFVYVAATLGQSYAMPAVTAYIVQEGRTYGMGICMTYFMMAMQTGNGVGPIALGFIADRFSLDWAFYSAAIALFISNLIFFSVIKDSDSLPISR
jgi:DHA1 family multidrug resistance protein-like MFS transporter